MFLDLGRGSSLRVMVDPEAGPVQNHWFRRSEFQSDAAKHQLLVISCKHPTGLVPEKALTLQRHQQVDVEGVGVLVLQVRQRFRILQEETRLVQFRSLELPESSESEHDV